MLKKLYLENIKSISDTFKWVYNVGKDQHWNEEKEYQDLINEIKTLIDGERSKEIIN